MAVKCFNRCMHYTPYTLYPVGAMSARAAAQPREGVLLRGEIGSNPPSYAVGDKEEVIYPACEPGEAVENIFIAHYIIPLALTAETLFMGLFGLILLCVFRKTRSIRFCVCPR